MNAKRIAFFMGDCLQVKILTYVPLREQDWKLLFFTITLLGECKTSKKAGSIVFHKSTCLANHLFYNSQT